MGKPVIVALLVVVAVAGFWVGRSSGATTAKTVVSSQVVKPTVIDRIPPLCDDTMKFAVATWQQMTDTPFADEIKAFRASPLGSLERSTNQQDLAGEAIKMWVAYGADSGDSHTVARCLSQWLHEHPGASP